MKTILNNWTFMRAFRMVIGLAVMVQAILQREPMTGLLAGFLLFTALANVGCCGTSGCAINPPKEKTKTIEYEELDLKK